MVTWLDMLDAEQHEWIREYFCRLDGHHDEPDDDEVG